MGEIKQTKWIISCLSMRTTRTLSPTTKRIAQKSKKPSRRFFKDDIVIGGYFVNELKALLLENERLCAEHGAVPNSPYRVPKNAILAPTIKRREIFSIVERKRKQRTGYLPASKDANAL